MNFGEKLFSLRKETGSLGGTTEHVAPGRQ